MLRLYLSLLVVVLLVSCTPATPVPQAGGETPENTPVIVFTRSGGFAGETLSYTIYADGRVEAEGAEVTDLDPAAVQTALAALEEAGFFELEIPAPEGTCNDCYEYTITVTSEGRSNTVTAVDNGQLPEAFFTVVETITGLFGE